jgi:hypothetical protein
MVVTIVSLALLVWITAVARLHWAPEGNTSKVSAFPSAWLTLLCVIVFGVLGGLISAIPVLARPPAAPDPYGLAVYEGTLKLPLEGVFAVIGCLALQRAPWSSSPAAWPPRSGSAAGPSLPSSPTLPPLSHRRHPARPRRLDRPLNPPQPSPCGMRRRATCLTG